MRHLLVIIFYQPIFNAMVLLYDVLPGKDLGLAIILLTIAIKLLLWPVSNGALRSQKALQDIQPKVEELKKKYPEKSQQEEMAKALMALYSQEKVSPFSSCLPLLIQLPVFIALYAALRTGLKSAGFDQLYPFVPDPKTIVPTLFGVLDLAKPSIILAVLAGIAQFFQARMMITRQQPKSTPGAADEEMLAAMNKQMLYVMPALTAFLGWRLPAGLTLYWCMSNALTVAQQAWYFRVHGKPGQPKPKQA